MPSVAKTALVSEATAYRYFPDLVTLLLEADQGTWPDPAEALAPVADSADPVERIGFAARLLLDGVLANESAVRAMIAGSITRPECRAAARPPVRPDRRRARSRGGPARSGRPRAAPAGPGRGGQRRRAVHAHRPVRAEQARRRCDSAVHTARALTEAAFRRADSANRAVVALVCRFQARWSAAAACPGSGGRVPGIRCGTASTLVPLGLLPFRGGGYGCGWFLRRMCGRLRPTVAVGRRRRMTRRGRAPT